jgi:hypothetical protein
MQSWPLSAKQRTKLKELLQLQADAADQLENVYSGEEMDGDGEYAPDTETAIDELLRVNRRIQEFVDAHLVSRILYDDTGFAGCSTVAPSGDVFYSDQPGFARYEDEYVFFHENTTEYSPQEYWDDARGAEIREDLVHVAKTGWPRTSDEQREDLRKMAGELGKAQKLIAGAARHG